MFSLLDANRAAHPGAELGVAGAELGAIRTCAHRPAAIRARPSHSGNLKQLHEGDAVFFEDADGNRFHDEVAELEILSPDAVEEMVEGDRDLPLFTCTLDGGSRVTVPCVLTESA